jgi:hypothetical protein
MLKTLRDSHYVISNGFSDSFCFMFLCAFLEKDFLVLLML